MIVFRFLSESTLTLADAIKKATSMEIATKNLVEMKKEVKADQNAYIHQIRSSVNIKGGCFRCGGWHAIRRDTVQESVQRKTMIESGNQEENQCSLDHM